MRSVTELAEDGDNAPIQESMRAALKGTLLARRIHPHFSQWPPPPPPPPLLLSLLLTVRSFYCTLQLLLGRLVEVVLSRMELSAGSSALTPLHGLRTCVLMR
ncbi:unnamed protein product [Leuciscus chuanchicus]